VERVVPGLEPGAIVLLHDAAEDDDFEPATLSALPRLLALLAEKGLAAVTLDELLADEESASGLPIHLNFPDARSSPKI
jgi:peptidoglycan/xylan/chitin deacetylase (PgdA/CDA1 family)